MDHRYAKRLGAPRPPRPRLQEGQTYNYGPDRNFAVVSQTAGARLHHQRQRFSYAGPVDILHHATGVYYGFPLSVYQRNPQQAPSTTPARPPPQPPGPGIHFEANPQEE